MSNSSSGRKQKFIRGTRGHGEQNSITWETIQEDYKRVGINISEEKAKDIYETVRFFSVSGYWDMRNAALKQARGEKLNSSEEKYLDSYKKIMEYTKIAPTFASKDKLFIYRGIHSSISHRDYYNKVLALKAGDKFDFDKIPTSFSTNKEVAKDYANIKGIIFKLPTSKLKNSFSVKGLSLNPDEDEVLLGDYNFKVKNNFFSQEDNRFIIELE